MCKVLIADAHYLSGKGLECVAEKNINVSDYILINIPNIILLKNKIRTYKPQLIFIDYISMQISDKELQDLMQEFPTIKFILITEWQQKENMFKYITATTKWHLLKECDFDEINDCIFSALNNRTFFCSRIIDFISEKNSTQKQSRKINCNGVNVTEREIEIIRLVASGLANKQIAEQLYLSVHTVITHRKNIMKKINVNNTAGVMLFALQHSLLDSTAGSLFATGS